MKRVDDDGDTLTPIRDAVEAAINAHLADGGEVVSKPGALLDLICEALGEMPDTWEYVGWKIERRPGSDFKGVRGARQGYFGWVATHTETGHKMEFKPSASNYPVEFVKDRLDSENELKAKVGTFSR